MRGRIWALFLSMSAAAGCTPAPPSVDKPFDVMTALQEANRALPEPGKTLRGTCHRITEKECW